MIRTSLAITAMSVLAGLPVSAQSPWEYEASMDSVTVVSVVDETAGPVETEQLLYEVSLDNRYKRTLQSGLQIDARLTVRGQRDNPTRPGFLGDFGTGVPARGAYSGLSGLAQSLNRGARGRIEAGYVGLDGGWGEVRAGLDRGVAARFHEGAPSALSHARINNPYLDPNGLKAIRTNHDLTGPSAKVSYASPRILGLRAGVSYTPEADADGLDRAAGNQPADPDLENAIEVAANISRRLRTPDLRVEAALAWSSAEVSSPLTGVRGDVKTVSAGANIELSDLTFGASWLSSDNGFENGDYEAWEVGAATEVFDTEVSLNYGEAEDDLVGLSSQAVSLAASQKITDGLDLAIAYVDEELDFPGTKRSGSGFVVEITLSSELFRLDGI